MRSDSPGPRVAKIMSEISVTPSSPGFPTRTTGIGLFWSANAFPPPMITLHASPTSCVPAGMVSVFVTRYVPASKKMILQPENCDCGVSHGQCEGGECHTLLKIACSAAVSSVVPSPFAPWSRTLTNWLTANASYLYRNEHYYSLSFI